jgi:hypothetical protein
VRIGDGSHVRFEVFEDEVIVGFFADHCHYEDRYSYLEEGEPDYIRRAGAFLKELFTYPVRHVANFKGKTLVAERYFLCYDDGREECPVGWTWYGLVRWINPFGKKRVVSTVWQFDRTKGTFVEMSAEER